MSTPKSTSPFAKQLKDLGKPLYFIVNQIDKHRDRELSFSSYRQSVEDAFHAWHLEPAGMVICRYGSLSIRIRNGRHCLSYWISFSNFEKLSANTV